MGAVAGSPVLISGHGLRRGCFAVARPPVTLEVNIPRKGFEPRFAEDPVFPEFSTGRNLWMSKSADCGPRGVQRRCHEVSRLASQRACEPHFRSKSTRVLSVTSPVALCYLNISTAQPAALWTLGGVVWLCEHSTEGLRLSWHAVVHMAARTIFRPAHAHLHSCSRQRTPHPDPFPP